MGHSRGGRRCCVLWKPAFWTAFGLLWLSHGCSGGGGARDSGPGEAGVGDTGSTVDASVDSMRGVDAAGIVCSSDRDCSALGFVCDRLRGVCVECASDTDCSTDQACRSNYCEDTTPCTSSRMCPGLVCDLALGYCVECVTEVDCTSGQICREGDCIDPPPPCSSDRQCSDMGLVCDVGRGYCVECATDLDCIEERYCGPDGLCLADVCSPGSAACDAGALRTCADNGSGWANANCGANEVCSGDACVMTACMPAERRCSGTTIEVCATDRLSWITDRICPAGQFCRSGECLDQACTPDSTFCDGGRVATCTMDGSSAIYQDCLTSEFCLDGACVPDACVPGTQQCADASTLEVCRADGSGYDATSCAAGFACDAGQCLTMSCVPNSVSCADDFTVSTCNPTGTSSMLTSCPTGRYCDAGVCEPQVCMPGSSVCLSSTELSACDARGSSATTSTCPAGAPCMGGACVSQCDPPPLRVVDPYPGDPCETSTLACWDACDGASCRDGCFATDPAAADCDTCHVQNSVSCANSLGCQDEWDAYDCCVSASCPGRDSACINASCAAELSAYNACSGNLAPGSCRDPFEACFGVGCTTALAAEDLEGAALGSHPSPWMDGCMGGTSYSWGVTGTAHAGAGALDMNFSGSGGEAAVGIPVTWPSSGLVWVSFWMRPETTTQNIYILPVRADQHIVNAVPFQKTGVLGSSGTPYSAGIWYHVEYELDFDASTFRMLVDGQEVASRPFSSSGLPCTLAGGSYLSFHGGYVDQKWRAQVDDLQILHYTAADCSDRFALSFDGSGDEVEFPTSIGDLGDRFTFEAWVRPTTATTGSEGEGAALFAHIADCTDLALFWSNSSYPQRFSFYVYPESGCAAVGAAASSPSVVGDWHHVAGVFDAGALRLYVNGALAGTATQTQPISWTASLFGHWAGRWGPDSRPERAAFTGEIDQIRVSRTARYSGATIAVPQELTADADTVALWLFDEGAGTTAADSSGNGFSGIIRGAQWVPRSR